MRFPLLRAMLLALLAIPALHADDKPPASPAPQEKAAVEPRWSIRVEAWLVTLSQEKALALLPALREETKIDAACTQLLAAVERKEATLTGDLVVQTVEETQGTTATNLEKIYPTQFQSYPMAKSPGTAPSAAPSDGRDPDYDVVTPTAFEKRNVGPQMIVQTGHVLSDRQWVRLTAQISRTVLWKYDAFDAGKTKGGNMLKLEQPLFQSVRDESELVLRSGQPVLFGVHLGLQPDGQTEIVILQANITPLH